MTKYLYLRFENATLIEKDHTNKQFIRSFDGKGCLEKSGYDLTTPIPYNVLSGVLSVLCGEIPVPTKRDTLFKRIDILDNIAKNSYIQYDFKPILNDKGYLTNKEIFTFSKSAYNANSTIKTTLVDCDGVEHEYPGKYNWNYLKRTFINNDNFIKLISFLTKLIGENCLSLTFSELYKKLTYILKNKNNNKIIDNFLENNKDIDDELKTAWKNVLFGKNATCSNTIYNSRTPLLLIKGVGKVVNISGYIICPIDDERIIKALHENCGVARILEGGIIYIKSLTKNPPIPYFKEKFEKIFSEKQAQIINNKEVI